MRPPNLENCSHDTKLVVNMHSKSFLHHTIFLSTGLLALLTSGRRCTSNPKFKTCP